MRLARFLSDFFLLSFGVFLMRVFDPWEDEH